ncbi:MFS transporter [Thalassorhabdus alkalitolerans]|uniref:Tetracycline resistance protein n=1 Tax=Thalassorhabdus alkalitolerans TaxID=2282697 RepID=A0ABW0YR72_9BACI
MTTSATSAHSPPELEPLLKKRLIRLVALILIFSVMNGTMFNVAIPDIADHFNLLPSQVSWVMTGYIMVNAVGALMYGKLADIFPIRSILTFGISMFALGALLGFLSPSYGFLLASRILQAIGGATIPALAFIIPTRFFPNERGKVFGIISSTIAFASGIGPIAGGLIAGILDWRYLFLFSVASVFAIPFFRKWMPAEEKREGKIDYLGALLFSIAIASFLAFVTTLMMWLIPVASLSFVLFILRIVKAEDPFIRPEMLKNRAYTITILTSFLGTSVLFGLIFVIPIMLRDLYDLSTLAIGFVLFPGAMIAGILGRSGGELVDKIGGEKVVVLALVLIGSGTILLSTFAGFAPWIIAVCLVISYIGFPLIQSSTANILSAILPAKQTGVGIGLFNLLNFVAGAFSSASFGAILDIQDTGIVLNPFALQGENAIFSNLFLGLTVLSFLALLLFSMTFKKHSSAD